MQVRYTFFYLLRFCYALFCYCFPIMLVLTLCCSIRIRRNSALRIHSLQPFLHSMPLLSFLLILILYNSSQQQLVYIACVVIFIDLRHAECDCCDWLMLICPPVKCCVSQHECFTVPEICRHCNGVLWALLNL